jgi:hypothetical protein
MTIDERNAVTVYQVYRLCGRYAEARALYYMKRHPEMTEAEACQAAIAWYRNTNRQRALRVSHNTGATK